MDSQIAWLGLETSSLPSTHAGLSRIIVTLAWNIMTLFT